MDKVKTVKFYYRSPRQKQDAVFDERVSELTEALNKMLSWWDEHVQYTWKMFHDESWITFVGSYVIVEKNDKYWAIRYPGATRGHILVEDMIIKEIELYSWKGDPYYDKVNQEVLDSFIGAKIELVDEYHQFDINVKEEK